MHHIHATNHLCHACMSILTEYRHGMHGINGLLHAYDEKILSQGNFHANEFQLNLVLTRWYEIKLRLRNKSLFSVVKTG